MAVALVYPNGEQGKRETSLKIKEVGINSGYLSQARFVLRHCPNKAEQVLKDAYYSLTKGQQAMAVALAYPETRQGKRTTSLFNNEVSGGYIRQARFVLRHCPNKAEQVLKDAYYSLTKGQQAMAVALAYPNPEKRGRGNKINSSKNEEFSRVSAGNLSMARFVLHHCRSAGLSRSSGRFISEDSSLISGAGAPLGPNGPKKEAQPTPRGRG